MTQPENLNIRSPHPATRPRVNPVHPDHGASRKADMAFAAATATIPVIVIPMPSSN